MKQMLHISIINNLRFDKIYIYIYIILYYIILSNKVRTRVILCPTRFESRSAARVGSSRGGGQASRGPRANHRKRRNAMAMVPVAELPEEHN